MRRFMERWYGEDGVALDVFFDDEHARFEVIELESELVVFTHSAFVEVLRFCMRTEEEAPAVPTDAVELSPWEPEAD